MSYVFLWILQVFLDFPDFSDKYAESTKKYSKDAKKDHEIIHTLMGNDVALRKDFIISNAIDVLNLDI